MAVEELRREARLVEPRRGRRRVQQSPGCVTFSSEGLRVSYGAPPSDGRSRAALRPAARQRAVGRPHRHFASSCGDGRRSCFAGSGCLPSRRRTTFACCLVRLEGEIWKTPSTSSPCPRSRRNTSNAIAARSLRMSPGPGAGALHPSARGPRQRSAASIAFWRRLRTYSRTAFRIASSTETESPALTSCWRSTTLPFGNSIRSFRM